MSRTHVELNDGSRVRFRPIEATDRKLLARSFERLGAQSRYQRFFSPVDHLSEGTLDYLTDVDHHDHEAVIALDDDGEMVGVARYVRVEERIAELAVTVIDEWQGRGLSGPLMERLVLRALDEGYDTFRAFVLAENPQAIEVIRRLGDATTELQGTTVQLDVALHTPDHARRTLAEIMRSAASGVAAPPLTAWRQLGSVLRVAYEGQTDPWDGADRLGDAIVAGSDGSKLGSAAVHAASRLAYELGAPLHVVAAYRPRSDGRGRADELLRSVSGSLVDCEADAHVHLRLGDPAESLVALAEQTAARMIVVGAPRRTGRGYLVGDVAEKVARHAPCHVLISRP